MGYNSVTTIYSACVLYNRYWFVTNNNDIRNIGDIFSGLYTGKENLYYIVIFLSIIKILKL